nr:cellulase family glycosylhydrolase [Rhodoblastus acidophilus]
MTSAGGLAASASRAQPAPRAYPSLRRGVNIHHVLNWPETTTSGGVVVYVWPPFRDARYGLGDGELRALTKLGFDFIRLTVDPGIVIAADGAKWPELRDHIGRQVGRLIASGFSVILDLHPVSDNPAYRPQALVQAADSPLFAAYVAMVGRVAEALRDFPPHAILFELMNEPWIESLSQASKWQPMLEALHARARAAAPSLPLLLSGMMWSDRLALMKLDVAPFRSSNVLYTFHYYDPHTYTHQGVEGDDARYVSGLAWPADSRGIADSFARAKSLVAADKTLSPGAQAAAQARTRQLLDELLVRGHDRLRVARDFQDVAQWASAKGIGADRIVLGEFGCVLSSNGLPVGRSRLDWLTAIRQTAEAVGFPWAYWAYKGYGGMELVDSAGRLHADLLTPLGLSHDINRSD